MPEALVDALLLRRFPGRTLEEIDRVNWPRLNRALAAQAILDVEDARDRYLEHQLKPTGAQWRAIVHHDELAGAAVASDVEDEDTWPGATPA